VLAPLSLLQFARSLLRPSALDHKSPSNADAERSATDGVTASQNSGLTFVHLSSAYVSSFRFPNTTIPEKLWCQASIQSSLSETKREPIAPDALLRGKKLGDALPFDLKLFVRDLTTGNAPPSYLFGSASCS
jgi:hypothetical protein